jgi:hypothetical protein
LRLLVPLLLFAGLALVPSAEAATVAIPGNPMTVYVSDVGRITAKHVRDEANVFYSPQETDSPNAGFTLGFPTAVGTIPAGTTFGPAGDADFIAATQGPVTGAGTAGSPYQVVTTYLASDGTTDAARITQTVGYISGQTRFSVGYLVENLSRVSALPIRAGEYADLYLADDEGTGVFRAGPPRFVGGRSADARVGGIEEVPTSPWDRFEEDAYTTVRANLVNLAGTGLDNSVNPALVDNGVAVQWNRSLAPLGSATFATAWTFENIGRPRQLPPAPEPPVVDNSIDAQLARLPAPAIGKAVNVAPVKGEVYVKLAATKSSVSAAQAKGRGFVPLSQARQIPVGSLLDTRKGVVRLVSAADARGGKQQADFNGGLFKTLQSRNGRGLTELRMSSGKFSGCILRGKRSSVAQSARRRYRKRTVRRLRGNGSGRFRTRGRYSSATVRGTDWTVTDRCDGTLTRVKRGRVAVRDLRRKKTITLRAGKRYLARAPG